MSPARVTFRRTVGVARSLYSSALSFAGFFLASALVFVYALERAEGSRISLAAVWCSSVSPVLPALAALLGMGVWRDEKTAWKPLSLSFDGPYSRIVVNVSKLWRPSFHA